METARIGNEKMVSGCVFKVLFQLDCESKEMLSSGSVGKERCHSGDCNLLAVSESHPLKKEIKRDWKCKERLLSGELLFSCIGGKYE